ncbi:MAG: ZIP family metal transporter [Clostridia bacterium]|nr:ZIP family metal transporter [Clostridia bacterium]
MTAIICFDLIPDALELGNISISLIGIIIGIVSMIFCDNSIKSTNSIKHTNKLFKTGMIVFLGLTIHNFPEGLAIGSGFSASESLGLSLAIAICIHDIPEGLSIALPLKKGGMNTTKAILITAISGITTGIGAFIGSLISNISPNFISISLGFAAGAMLYIVSCELIPESKHIYKGRFPALGNIIGVVCGAIAHSLI